jgi:hypothetical protein
VERLDWFHHFSIFFGCFSFVVDEWISLVADFSFLAGSPTIQFRGLIVFPGEPIDLVARTTSFLDGPPFDLGGPSVHLGGWTGLPRFPSSFLTRPSSI